MIIPSYKRFKRNENSEYVKRFNVHTETYDIYVPVSEWTEVSRKAMNRLIMNDNVLKMSLPYSARIEMVNVNDTDNTSCPHCNKPLSDFKGKQRHINICKMKNVSNHRIVSTTSGIGTTNVNNVTNNNTQNNIHFNFHGDVKINPFGKENNNWITNSLLRLLAGPKYETIQHIIEEKHFNKKHPENQNIRMHNEDHLDKFVQVYTQDEIWKLKDTNKILYSICTDIADLMGNVIEGEYLDDYDTDCRKTIEQFRNTNYYNRILPKIKERYDDIIELSKNDEQLKGKVLDIFIMAICNRKLIEQQMKDKTLQNDT